MKRLNHAFTLVAAFVPLSGTIATLAQSPTTRPSRAVVVAEHSWDTLKEIREFPVVVEEVNAEAEKHGITHDAIQTQVELRLRKAGIRVIPKEEGKSSANGYLYVNLNFQHMGASPVNAASVSVEYKQPVMLVHDFKTVDIVTTWKIEALRMMGDERVKEGLSGSLEDLVDRFANDYLTANPPPNR